MKIARLALLMTLPLLLASCLYSPGTFTSDMVVQANGAFSFRYKGEIVFLSLFQMMQDKDRDSAEDGKCWGSPPDAENAQDGAMDMAVDAATESGETAQYGMAERDAPQSEIKPVDPDAVPVEEVIAPVDVEGARDCTAGELAERAESKAQTSAKKKEEAARFQQMLGFNPEDEATMQALAAQIARQKGWKSVVYRGKGIFDVDYEIAGMLDRDFLFPVYPDASVIYPMVIARRRADGTVQITAPSFANTAGNPMAAMAMMGAMGGDADKEAASPSPANGGFTLKTDAPILTNNTEDGAAPMGTMQQLYWPVTPRTTKIPETLLRLSR